MKNITLHVSGTHCNSCKMLIENILSKHPGIQLPTVDLKNQTVTFEIEGDQDPEKLAENLTKIVKHNGYSLSVEKQVREKRPNGDIWQALPIGLVILAAFFVLQKSGILNFGIGTTATPVTGFAIGLVASVSSCLAVVGGLILSLSATVYQDKVRDTKSILLFHSGRLIGFALLGGLLGSVGGAIGISFTLGSILGIIASLVMIILGIHLVGITKTMSIALPSGIFNYFRKIEHSTLTPILLGVGTFFLPCGFTQSMQIAALSSGSFFSGLLIMLAFALGTLPVLSLLSFGSASVAHSKYSSLFLKSAGVVVIGLGIFALITGLAGLGIINPLFTV